MWSKAPTTLGSTAERASLTACCKPTMSMTEPRLSKTSWKRGKGSEGLFQVSQGSPSTQKALSTDSQSPRPSAESQDLRIQQE